jgi:hypothetical protein
MIKSEHQLWEQELRHNKEIVLWFERSERWKTIVHMWVHLMAKTEVTAGLTGDALIEAVHENSEYYIEIQKEIQKAQLLDDSFSEKFKS